MSGGFDETGTPFRLFEAPISDAADVRGEAKCSLCGEHRFCLDIGVGHELLRPCGSCGAQTAFAATGEPEECVACGVAGARLAAVDGDPACLVCLTEGRWAITKDSPLGMIRWRDAVAGETYGVPFADDAHTAGFETSPPNEEGWRHVRVSPEVLLPLVHTPDFLSIQGSVWEFHCGAPMVFVGRWSQADFARRAPDGDGAAFAKRIGEVVPDFYKSIGADDPDDGGVSAYAFRCSSCSAYAANYDFD